MRVNPSWEQIDSLLSKPPKEVIYLTKEFDLALPNDWEIYIRPFMNGDQPDIVLLNPKIGIVFIEVVFWMKDQIKFKKKIYQLIIIKLRKLNCFILNNPQLMLHSI